MTPKSLNKTITLEIKTALIAVGLVFTIVGSVYGFQFSQSQTISTLELSLTKDLADVKSEVEAHGASLQSISDDLIIIKRELLRHDRN